MEYYFLIAGSHHQQDYRWWKVSDEKNRLEVKLSAIPTIKALELNEWLDGDSSGVSLLLGRRDHNTSELLLFITNLPTKRQDYQRRTIKNSLLCIAKSSEEYLLRQLASAVLSNDQMVADALDVSLKEDGEGFMFDWTEFLSRAEITKQHPPIDKWHLGDGWENLHFRIAKDSSERRKEVSSYLLSDIEIPKNLNVVFLLTRYKESKFYDERSDCIGAVLSELEDKEQWRSNQKKTNPFNDIIDAVKGKINLTIKQHFILAIFFVVLIMLIKNNFYTSQWFKEPLSKCHFWYQDKPLICYLVSRIENNNFFLKKFK